MPALGTLANIAGDQNMFRGQALVDFASITNATSGTVAVTLTGLQIGDLVLVAPTTALTSGLAMDGMYRAVAADTITLRATNCSAAPIDQASQTMTFLVSRSDIPL